MPRARVASNRSHAAQLAGAGPHDDIGPPCRISRHADQGSEQRVQAGGRAPDPWQLVPLTQLAENLRCAGWVTDAELELAQLQADADAAAHITEFSGLEHHLAEDRARLRDLPAKRELHTERPVHRALVQAHSPASLDERTAQLVDRAPAEDQGPGQRLCCSLPYVSAE